MDTVDSRSYGSLMTTYVLLKDGREAAATNEPAMSYDGRLLVLRVNAKLIFACRREDITPALLDQIVDPGTANTLFDLMGV